MRGSVVVGGSFARLSNKINSRMMKTRLTEFHLRAAAKDILDIHCLEWTMDGGNSGSMK